MPPEGFHRTSHDTGIAIIGMACVYPGAANLNAYWSNILAGVDAVSDVPAHRWDRIFYDPSSASSDRLYCKRGGFIDDYAAFDALAFGIMPMEAEAAEPDQLLALQAAHNALADAGYADRPFARDRTGVILGRGNYMSVGLSRMNERLRTAEQLVACVRTMMPDVAAAKLAQMKSAFQAALGEHGPGTAIGLVPNLTASRICNRLDLHGPAHTIDAACASSLVAVDQACDQLRDGGADLMLAGGVHLTHDVTFWSVFCQLGALSRTQQIRPFDRHADGLLIGEGLGVLALKRMADAERDGDRIYAVIRGCGVASDGRAASLMNPRSEGQVMALERAWAQAGLPPASVGLIEAHGTATPVGDATEIETLGRFFGAAEGESRAGLGSVKSMIGHTMPAAGAAGLIKAALAVYHGVLPPTLHCESPSQALDATRFRLIARSEPWNVNGTLRRAGVNAFGFGGINAHVVLEAHERKSRRSRQAKAAEDSQPVLALAAGNADALAAALVKGDPSAPDHGPCRLVILNPTPERIARANSIVLRGAAWRGPDDIWFVPEGLVGAGGQTAILFPGLDSSFHPRLDDLADQFGPAPPAATGNLGEMGVSVIAVNRYLHRAITGLGLRADLIAGHSVGEWNAMIASGMLDESAVDEFVESLGAFHVEVPNVVYAAAGCGAHQATAICHGLPDIYVSHDNCSLQVILCGVESSVDAALGRFRAAGVLCEKLKFRSGFHSPLLAGYMEPFVAGLARFTLHAPRIPIWSATTCAPYPTAPDEIRELARRHLVESVRFRELIEALYDHGVRLFVQAGSGSLPNFVGDTLRDRPHVAIAANLPKRSGLSQLRRTAAALFAEGLDVQWSALTLAPHETPAPKSPSKPLKLALGIPMVQLAAWSRPSSLHPVEAEFETSLNGIQAAQSEVRLAWQQGPAPESSCERRPLSVETFPELLDHCLFVQSPNCTSMLERYPVVPMTTSIAMLLEAARRLAPHRAAVVVEGVRSYRWMAVAPPIEVEINARMEGSDRVTVTIEGYVEGAVRLADNYPPAPALQLGRFAHERPSQVSRARLYRDRWMFHGPAFQGIVELGPWGADGIVGKIETGATPGALLDNAGQLLGYWVMVNTRVERLAMPIRVERLEFFGPDPAPGTLVTCRVAIRDIDAESVRADMELTVNDRLWAKITGWEDRRLTTDDRLWPVLNYPESHLLSIAEPEGYTWFHDIYRQAPARDFLARRFLCEAEHPVYHAVAPRRQRAWLAGLIAAKDAVRAWHWAHGGAALFPAEINLAFDDAGRPRVHGPFAADLRITIAHKDDVAAAMVAEGSPIGIGIERFEAGDAESERRARWQSARQAVAKARGENWKESLDRLVVTEEVDGCLSVDGTRVKTRRHGTHVLSHT